MLTADQVTALVPDAASFKAGKALAVPRKWFSLGGDDEIIWGLAQGSGKKPYQIQVALGELAYKCSCPSRKFPCKHAIGLMFIAAENSALLTEKEHPEWVTEWLQAREANEKKAQTRAENKAKGKPKDEKAAAKRQARKSARIEEGVSHLKQVLVDLISKGIGQEEVLNQAFWDGLSSRLVDYQTPGLAGYVRRLGELADSQLGWESRFLHELGALYTLVNCYPQFAEQPVELQEELRQLVGVNTGKDKVLSETGIVDKWFVAARRQTEQDRLTTSATWLYGQNSKRWALKLEFAVPPSQPREHWPVGSTVNTELVYYPGIAADRVLPHSESISAKIETLPACPHHDFEDMLNAYAKQLAENPWRSRMLFLLSVKLGRKAAQLHLVDQQGHGVPCDADKELELLIMSLTGGQLTLVCGEWNGYQAQVLSIADGSDWVSIQGIKT